MRHRIWARFRGLAALLAGAVLPLALLDAVLTWPQDFAAEPAWSWPLVAILPLAAGALLLISPERRRRLARPAGAILAAHAALLIVMLGLGCWIAIAGISLFVDLLLVLALAPGLLGLRPGRLSSATLLWMFVGFGLGFPAALANALVVRWRAEALAGDRPYCIQTASQTDAFAYEPARSLFDLSLVKMQARLVSGAMGDRFHFQTHAVLFIAGEPPRFLNWSYAHEGFLDEVLNHRRFQDSPPPRFRPVIYCAPRPHFAADLPLWSAAPTLVAETVGQRRFAIPEAYRPRRIDDGFVIDALPPGFAPYDPRADHLPAQFYADISVKSADAVDLPTRLDRWRSWVAAGDAMRAAPEFDLDKLARVGPVPEGRLYAGYGADGAPMRTIECGTPITPGEPACRAMFVAGGFAVGLWMADPSQWRAIEDQLTRLVASFETTPPR